ncbi:SEC-C domain-containing protein [uncultured Ferrimonas sp.]|uniref:SEC-C domain-containing protein n=1 Tax=uncultured Ferrimonas sp. TaxID=432640 RepID=UPI002601EC0A|nr:SEC-C domain-containing protein [uncultured Ferrimonas sp.]
MLDATTDSSSNLHFAKSAFNVLSSPVVANDTLDKLKIIIAEQQKSEKKETDDFIKTIELEVPELSGLSNLIVPTNAGEFYSMLGFLLTLILFIQTMRASNKQPEPTIINNYYGSQDPEKSAYEAAHKSGGLKRKELCPCGSGKKFKNCHGD